jgi:hypothetical protein
MRRLKHEDINAKAISFQPGDGTLYEFICAHLSKRDGSETPLVYVNALNVKMSPVVVDVFEARRFVEEHEEFYGESRVKQAVLFNTHYIKNLLVVTGANPWTVWALIQALYETYTPESKRCKVIE